MTGWDGLNRRRFPRVIYPCLIIVRGQEQEEVILTHTENLGSGGVCLIIKNNLKMFSKVDLEIDLLDVGDHIKCEGKVVWSIRRKNEESKKPSYYDTGVEFVNIHEKDLSRIQEVVSRVAKQGGNVNFA